jgi:hypothetical protein
MNFCSFFPFSLIYAKSNGKKQNDDSHPGNKKSEDFQDMKNLPLGERQKT